MGRTKNSGDVATPRSRRQLRNRQSILDAAQALLNERGVERFSLRAVAKRADFSPAALYEYFDGKDAILAELARRAQAPLVQLMAEVAHGDDPDGPLVAAGMAYVRFAREYPEDFLLLFSRLSSKRRALTDGVEQTSAFGILLELVARERAARGATAAVDDQEIAYAVWAAAHGAALLQLTHLAGFDADFAAADRRLFAGLVTSLFPP